MSGKTAAPLDDQFADLLAACDESLAGGLPTTTPYSDAVPPELAPRLADGLACLRLLEEVWPRRRTAGSTPRPPGDLGDVEAVASPPRQFGRFQVRRELGRGGYGVVLLAFDPRLGREVALKIPRVTTLITAELRARFHLEARAAAALDHPNIVSVYEAGEVGPICYIASAYCPGISLEGWLRQHGPVPVEMAADLTAALADAVQHAHSRGVLHRDLKPANVLLQFADSSVRDTLGSDGGIGQLKHKPEALAKDCPSLAPQACVQKVGPSLALHACVQNVRAAEVSALFPRKSPNLAKGACSTALIQLQSATPKIADFGLAKLLGGEEADLTQSGAILGTPTYMAPEQALGRTREITTAVDIYALGAILYTLLTNRPPFAATTSLETLRQVESCEPVPPSKLRRQLPHDLEVICLTCLQKEPRRRYGSAVALAEDLRLFRAGQPIRARAVGKGERLWRWCRRNPTLAAAGTLAILALVATVVLAVSFGHYQSAAAARLHNALDESETRRVLLAETNQNLQETDRRRGESLQLAATLIFERGLALWEQGEPRLAMLWLARSLEMTPPEAPELADTIRANLALCACDFQALQRATTHQHDAPALAGALSPDGRTILTGSQDHSARLWDYATGRPSGPPLRHRGPVTAVAFSRDGRTLLTGSQDGTARLWVAATGKPLGPELVHQGPVRLVAFSPDGTRALTGSVDHTARLWDARTGMPVGEPLNHEKGVSALAFNPDGRLVATGGQEGTARLWEAATGRSLGPPLRNRLEVEDLPFSPDGKTLLTGFKDGGRLWDVERRQPLGDLLIHGDWAVVVAFSPDGRLAATGSLDKTARLWDVPTGKPHGPPLVHKGTVYAVAFSADGRRLLTGSTDQTARLWDVATGRPLGPSLPHQGLVGVVAFHPDGQGLVTMCTDQTCRSWDAGEVGRSLGLAPRHKETWVLALSPHADGRTLLMAWGNNEVLRRWDPRKGVEVGQGVRLFASLEPKVFTSGGRYLLTGSGDRRAQLWDPTTGLLLGQTLAHTSRVKALDLSPDGSRIATGAEDGTVQLWEVASGQPVGQPMPHPAPVWSVAFSPNGKRLLTGCGQPGEPAGEARLWDPETGQPLGVPLAHLGAVRAVAFSPDGRWFATAGMDHQVRLWASAGEPRTVRLMAHQRWVNSLAFSPDGRTLLTGSEDRTARLWVVATGLPLGPPLVHADEVKSVAFAADGRSVATGTWETAHLWRLPSAAPASVQRLAVWAQVITGLRLDDRGTIHVLDGPTWQKWRQRLDELGGPPMP